MSNFRPEVAVTAIIRMDNSETGRYLLLRRAATKKRFPLMWTVPGGHIEGQDYVYTVPNVDGWVYGVVEAALQREVIEEAGIHIENIEYLTSMVMDNKQGQVLVLSMIATMSDHGRHTVSINHEESCDYMWATLDEAKTIGLIAGIYEELEEAEKRFQSKSLKSVVEGR